MSRRPEEDCLTVLRQCFSESVASRRDDHFPSTSSTLGCVEFEPKTPGEENLVREGLSLVRTTPSLSQTEGTSLSSSRSRHTYELIGRLLQSTGFDTYDPCARTTSVGILWNTSWTRRLFVTSLHLCSLASPQDSSQTDETDNANTDIGLFNSEDEVWHVDFW